MNVERDMDVLGQLPPVIGDGSPVGIFAADLVGYSDLIFRDLHNAVAVLHDGRGVLASAIDRYGGTVVETPGDFVLAFFPDASNLLMAAIESQRLLMEHLKQRNDFSAGHWKIGLEVGEVHAIDGGYYGNAINVAARLQALAAPGEVWFTNLVPQSVASPSDVEIQQLGSKQLKNIGGRISVLCAKFPEYEERVGAQKVSAIVPPDLSEVLKKPVLQIRQLRSIGDGNRSSLISEALTSEIGLILSRLSGSIIVIHDIGTVTPDYVLHGSIQEYDERLRVNVQVSSAIDGRTVWAERFESDLRGSFDLQDQIARDIVSALQLTLTEGEQSQLWRRGTSSGKAWEAFQRGHDLERRYTRESHRSAKLSYEEALSIDPEYLNAMVALGFCYLDEIRLGWAMDDDICLSAATAHCISAQELAENHPDVLALQAYVAFFEGDMARSREVMSRSVSLSPQSSEIMAYQGALHDLMGDYHGAVNAYKDAISLSPSAPAWIPANLGLSLLAMDEGIEAESVFKEVLKHYPDYARAWLGLTVALVKQGRMAEAQKAASSLLEFDRQFTVKSWARSMPYNDETMMTQFTSDLRAAGLN